MPRPLWLRGQHSANSLVRWCLVCSPNWILVTILRFCQSIHPLFYLQAEQGLLWPLPRVSRSQWLQEEWRVRNIWKSITTRLCLIGTKKGTFVSARWKAVPWPRPLTSPAWQSKLRHVVTTSLVPAAATALVNECVAPRPSGEQHHAYLIMNSFDSHEVFLCK